MIWVINGQTNEPWFCWRDSSGNHLSLALPEQVIDCEELGEVVAAYKPVLEKVALEHNLDTTQMFGSQNQ